MLLLSLAFENMARPGLCIRSAFYALFLSSLSLLCFCTLAHAQISVRSDLVHDADALPGHVYTGVIRIVNTAATPQQAKIYPIDYRFSAQGINRFEQPGSHVRSNAPWIGISARFVTLFPGEAIDIGYEVRVPQQVRSATSDSLIAPTGTYWSMLMVEPVPPGSPESTLPTPPDNAKAGMRQMTRFGVQIATHIVDESLPQLAFIGAEFSASSPLAQDNRTYPKLMVDIENQGRSMERPEVWAEVYNETGQLKARIEGSLSRMYPGTSVRQVLPLKAEIEKGRHQALVFVRTSSGHVFGKRYTIEP